MKTGPAVEPGERYHQLSRNGRRRRLKESGRFRSAELVTVRRDAHRRANSQLKGVFVESFPPARRPVDGGLRVGDSDQEVGSEFRRKSLSDRLGEHPDRTQIERAAWAATPGLVPSAKQRTKASPTRRSILLLNGGDLKGLGPRLRRPSARQSTRTRRTCRGRVPRRLRPPEPGRRWPRAECSGEIPSARPHARAAPLA